MAKRRLRRTRVLIVLDDVSKPKQLKHLVSDGDLFASSSRILLKIRDQKVLRTIKDSYKVKTFEYEVEQLNYSEALDLFNFTAFDEVKPPTSEYAELSKRVVYYAGCIPLAIKVVGNDLEEMRDWRRMRKGTANIQGLFLDYSEIDGDIHLEPTIFEKMCNLRLLKIVGISFYKQRRMYIQHEHERGMYLQHGLQYLPDSLRYLKWNEYPLESLPPTFKPSNLVELKMKHSQLKQLWDGDQVIEKLRGIDLSYCRKLTRIPDVSASPDLERINLACCEFWREIPYSQIQQNLNNLIEVNLRSCDSLRKVPDRILDAASLRTLTLDSPNLLPTVITSRSLEFLDLSSTVIKETSSVDNCKQLSNLRTGLHQWFE
ncbi:disease resistance protein RRS1-like [Morus notabilis]|uniref:disease resistance protein RRS1-like n=1 Tax=Morus notabilis TaxID=981085 RepID=UPI000CED104D|nr:disease resistance protein RRS1-like [Morus notabilis]